VLRLILRNPLRLFSFLCGWFLSNIYVDDSKQTFPILLETPGIGIKIIKHRNAKLIINGQLVVEKRSAPGSIGAPIILLHEGAELVINNRVKIGPNTHIEVGRKGRLLFGEEGGGETSFSYGCKIVANQLIKIGSSCLFSWDVLIMDTSTHYINGQIRNSPIVISDYVWVAAKAIILKGVAIASNSIIATGAIVTKSIPENCLAGGNPAQIIRNNVEWKP
jgi:acetyltransferase-like isoleucine patch superfamily enzyme